MTSYKRETHNLINDVIFLVYFMRGAISYNEMMEKTPYERQNFDKFIQSRLEGESKKAFQNY